MCFNDGFFVCCEIKTNWSLRRVLVELKSKTKLYKYALILISKKIQLIPEEAPNATANNFYAGNECCYGHFMEGLQSES